MPSTNAPCPPSQVLHESFSRYRHNEEEADDGEDEAEDREEEEEEGSDGTRGMSEYGGNVRGGSEFWKPSDKDDLESMGGFADELDVKEEIVEPDLSSLPESAVQELEKSK